MRTNALKITLYISILITFQLYTVCVKAQNTLKDKLETNTSSIQMLSIGGSLSSGVQNDGLIKNYQLNSFTSMLAKSLNIKSFVNPNYFESQIIIVDTDNENIPIFNRIKTNERISHPEINNLFDTEINSINNIAIPFQAILNIGKSNITQAEKYLESRSFEYLEYLQKNNANLTNKSYVEIVELKSKENFDFFIYELGFDDFIAFMKSGGGVTSIDYIYNSERKLEEKIIQGLANKAEGVILNIPDPRTLPFFNVLSQQRLQELGITDRFFIEEFAGSYRRELSSDDVLLHNNYVYNTLKKSDAFFGRSFETPFYDAFVLSNHELSNVRVNTYNKRLSFIAKKFNVPIVDLNNLYNKILDGSYITHDGIQIDSSYPNGNFFSNDGIFPTEIGHRVICNEIISTINTFYGTNIAYLKTLNDK